ncbi:hypothetical protein DP43_5266 [Burkholderia pseudomallei]|nr:hypothetical protein DP43_5266 [Burkholderia pseudomallei]
MFRLTALAEANNKYFFAIEIFHGFRMSQSIFS